MIYKLLSSKNWIPYFKPLAKAFRDNDPAILLSELANQHQDYEEKELLTEDGYFFCTAEKLEEQIFLSTYKQAQAIDKLEKAGLIETKLKGVPAKKHFRFPDGFENKFSNFLKTGFEEISKQGLKNFENIKETQIKKPNKRNTIKSNDLTLPLQIETDPLKEKNKKKTNKENSEDAVIVLQYLNEKAVRGFETQGVKAKANLKIIEARLKEGFKVDELKKIVDCKVAQWYGDTKMNHCLRPATLFIPSHCSDYLEESTRNQTFSKETNGLQFDTDLNGQTETYKAWWEGLKEKYPNVATEIRFMKASEFREFISPEPSWFPIYRQRVGAEMNKKRINQVLADLESNPNRKRVAEGGLYAHLTTQLTEMAL